MTQRCAFLTEKHTFVIAPELQGKSLSISNRIGILGVDISSEVQFRRHVEGKTKLALKKLGMLNQAILYFIYLFRFCYHFFTNTVVFDLVVIGGDCTGELYINK